MKVNGQLKNLVLSKKVFTSDIDNFDDVLNSFYLSDIRDTIEVVLDWTKNLFFVFREEMLVNLDKFINHFTKVLIRDNNKVFA